MFIWRRGQDVRICCIRYKLNAHLDKCQVKPQPLLSSPTFRELRATTMYGDWRNVCQLSGHLCHRQRQTTISVVNDPTKNVTGYYHIWSKRNSEEELLDFLSDLVYLYWSVLTERRSRKCYVCVSWGKHMVSTFNYVVDSSVHSRWHTCVGALWRSSSHYTDTYIISIANVVFYISLVCCLPY